MADYRQCIPFILKWEGGWSNDPSDKGGMTMRGVTITTYRHYCEINGRPDPSGDDLRSISRCEWEDIFKSMFWDRWQGDKILSQSIANICVDWVWASGSYGVKRVQRLLGVREDGIVGENTLAALNRDDPSELFGRIKSARLAFVDEIVRSCPSNGRFSRGWKNRINDIKFIA